MTHPRRGPTGFGARSTAQEVTDGLDLTDKTFLVTGANSGLGAETTRVLSLRGAAVICLARSQDKANAAAAAAGPAAVGIACELSEPASVREAVEAVRALEVPLDGLIANAGIMALPHLEQKYGFELQFLTNHVGHFTLCTGLVDQLGPHGRVVVLSSDGHRYTYRDGIPFDNLSGERAYDPIRSYGVSKLANLLFTVELARRFEGTDQTANAVHPGLINTNLVRHVPPLLQSAFDIVAPMVAKTVEQGAATQCYVATHPAAAGISGRYWSDCNVAEPSRHGRDRQLAARLWRETERIVAELP